MTKKKTPPTPPIPVDETIVTDPADQEPSSEGDDTPPVDLGSEKEK